MDPIRPAGYNEKRCIIREHLRLYNNIVTIGTYTNTANLSNNDYIKAIKHCILEHPVLSTAVRDADTETPMLVHHTPLDISKHLQVSGPGNKTTEADLVHLLERIHNERPTDNEDEPQWKVYIFPLAKGKSCIAFSISHGLTDGVSGYAFHASFLNALQNLSTSTQDTDPIFRISYPKSFLPPLEQAGTLRISWSFLLAPLANEYLPITMTKLLGLYQASPSKVWFGAAARPSRDNQETLLQTSAHIITIPSTLLSSILNICRKNDIRLTGLLHVLISHALSRALHKRGQDSTTFLAQTAINLRPALDGKGTGQMAAYVSVASDTILVSDPSSSAKSVNPDWKTARHMTQNLASASSTLSDQPIGLLHYLSNYRSWLLKNAAARADVSYEVSNVGVFSSSPQTSQEGGDREARNGHEEKVVQVEDMLFSQSANAVGPPLNVNVASTKGGRLAVSFTWWRGMLGVEDEREFVEEVGEDVVRELRGLGE